MFYALDQFTHMQRSIGKQSHIGNVFEIRLQEYINYLFSIDSEETRYQFPVFDEVTQINLLQNGRSAEFSVVIITIKW